jgi:hypothetical protein
MLFAGDLFDKGFIQDKRLFFWEGNDALRWLFLLWLGVCKGELRRAGVCGACTGSRALGIVADLSEVYDAATLLLSHMIGSSAKASCVKQERCDSSSLAVSSVAAASASSISCNSDVAMLPIVLSDRIPSKILAISASYSVRSRIDSCSSARICWICSASSGSSAAVDNCVGGREIGRRHWGTSSRRASSREGIGISILVRSPISGGVSVGAFEWRGGSYAMKSAGPTCWCKR